MNRAGRIPLEVHNELRRELAALAARYTESAGDELDGLTTLGEDLLMYANRSSEHSGWVTVLRRLQALSG